MTDSAGLDVVRRRTQASRKVQARVEQKLVDTRASAVAMLREEAVALIDACVAKWGSSSESSLAYAVRGPSNYLAVVRNNATFLTASSGQTMSTTATKILLYAQQQPEGAVFGANELVECGERAAIDQALVRLTATGELTRVARGIYALTVSTRFGRRAPDLERLVRGYARREALVVARHGGAEANRLGLSTQVPMHAVWLTSGPTTELHSGALTVELKRAPRWLLVDPEGRAGAALRAVAWLGAEAATEHFVSVRETLTAEERQTILDARGLMPSWMARSTSAALAHG